jgi:sugar phosphate isomerase/epimerase
MTIKLAAQEQMLHGGNLTEKWAFAQAAGFDGIELRGEGNHKFRERLPEIRAARAAGAVIPTVCVMMDHFLGDFDPERRHDAIDNMKDLLSVIVEAGGFGAITPAAFGLFSRALPPFRPPRSPEEDRKVLLDGLHELGEYAAKEGAIVLLEPLNRYEDHMVNTLEQAASYCRELDLDSVRVVGDFFHMNIEEPDRVQSLRDVASLIAHMQLGDSSRLEPGTGHIDFASAFAALGEAGYDGWYALECALSGDPAVVLPAVAAYLRDGPSVSS